jgi:DNA-(apurinic or apyrimidinic site) lyase
MRVSINISRAEELGTILKRFGVELVEVFERKDPQYKALEELYNELRECNSLALLTVLNSIVSYQLSATGEEYWWEFARYKEFSSGVGDPEDLWRRFRNFLLSSRGNVASREIKIERLERIRRTQFHIELYVRYIEYIKNLDLLVSRLAEVLRQNIYDKTIVFSTKIYGYGLRIIGYKIIFPFEIFIPIDNRIGKISKDKNYWIGLSKRVNIPLLHIDSLIWITMGLTNNKIERIRNEELKNKIKLLKNYLNSIINNQ